MTTRKLYNILFNIPVLILILALFSCFVYSENVNTSKKVKVMQFDTILELNAPKIGTNVLLLARYWVSEDFYSIGIRWAEPHIGARNFPTYLPGFVIYSNNEQFSMNNQRIEVHNQPFSKPTGDRGIFRYSANAYPMDNIRFAEKEALESRIYMSDFANYSISDSNEWQRFKIPDKEKDGIKRDVNELLLMGNNGNITKIALGDSKGLLLKGIDYEYSMQNGKSFLKKQTVTLPERGFMVGFNGKGAELTINGQKKNIKDVSAIHHKGGRKCFVDYETIQTDSDLISVPTKIDVQSIKDKSLLRTAKMSNFVQLEMSKEEVKQAAIDFGYLNIQELEANKLFEKYLLESREKMEPNDLSDLEKLNKYFVTKMSNAKTLADKLKNLSLLIKIDLVLDTDNLPTHFMQYLDLLRKDNRKNMILFGGLYTIETTAKWKGINKADMLLKIWLDNSLKYCEPEEILLFSQNNIKRESFWEVINLLESYLKSNKQIELYQFDIQSVKCEALFNLYNAMKNPSEKDSNKIKLQVEWALKSSNINEFHANLKKSLDKSLESFSLVKEPNHMQNISRSKLEQISKQINN